MKREKKVPNWQQALLAAGVVLALLLAASFGLYQWRYARSLDALENSTEHTLRVLEYYLDELLPAYAAAQQAPEDESALRKLLFELDQLLAFGMEDSQRSTGVGPVCLGFADLTDPFRARVLTLALKDAGLWAEPSLDDYAARLKEYAGISLDNFIRKAASSVEEARRLMQPEGLSLSEREKLYRTVAGTAFRWLTEQDDQWYVYIGEKATTPGMVAIVQPTE